MHYHDAVMHWIDGHLDLAYLHVGGRDMRRHVSDDSDGCVSLPALREAGVEIAFATMFTEPGLDAASAAHGYESSDDVAGAEAAGLRQLAVYEQWEAEGEISIVRRKANLEGEGALPRVLLLMEGADPIRSPDEVRRWFDRGLRIVGLAWAAGTRYAGGNSRPPGAAPRTAAEARWPENGALTSLGVELVKAMDALGIVHDASHLSDRAFDGLLEHATGPLIASHSNARALVEPWQRHLRDDQIRRIGDRGGIVGLNLFSPFLVRGRRAAIDDCVAHIEHVAHVMGHRRGIALGSDMDGGFGAKDLPVGLDHPRKLSALADALRRRNWPDDDIHAFAHTNWRRLLQTALQ